MMRNRGDMARWAGREVLAIPGTTILATGSEADDNMAGKRQTIALVFAGILVSTAVAAEEARSYTGRKR